jgi:hypothetical protein
MMSIEIFYFIFNFNKKNKKNVRSSIVYSFLLLPPLPINHNVRNHHVHSKSIRSLGNSYHHSVRFSSCIAKMFSPPPAAVGAGGGYPSSEFERKNREIIGKWLKNKISRRT